VFGTYQALLGESVPLQRLGRLEFYATCREPDLAVCVAPATTGSKPTSC
jgi:hypothetical protein